MKYFDLPALEVKFKFTALSKIVYSPFSECVNTLGWLLLRCINLEDSPKSYFLVNSFLISAKE